MSSPSVEAMLEALQRDDPVYEPNPEVAADLHEKVLGMMVGPAFTGKSTIISRACELDPEFAAASSFTTRPRRESDGEGEYVFHPHTSEGIGIIYGLQQQGDLAQYVAFPGLGYIYGSVPSDYPKPYNLRPVMATAVGGMLRAPFLRHHTLGIACPPTEWDERDRASTRTRGEEAAKQRSARVKEGAKSLDWLLSHPETQWISNHRGGLKVAAQTVVRVVRQEAEAPQDNRRMGEDLYRHLSRIATEL